MFKKILIANRGEIACRVIRTARKMGIGTAAAAALWAPPAAEACPARPHRMPAAQVRQVSDVVVRGVFTYSWDPTANVDDVYYFSGNIAARSVSKGPRMRSYMVRQGFRDSYCLGYGWEPSQDGRAIAGRFFLKRHEDGSYFILRYER